MLEGFPHPGEILMLTLNKRVRKEQELAGSDLFSAKYLHVRIKL